MAQKKAKASDVGLAGEVMMKIKEEPFEFDEEAVILPGDAEHSIKIEYNECDEPVKVQHSIKMEYEELDQLAETVLIEYATEEENGQEDENQWESETPSCNEEEGSKRWRCHQCSYSYDKRRDLRIHRKTHASQSEKTFQCNVAGCAYAATTKQSLTVHMTKQHGGKKKLVKCPQAGCKYSARNKRNLLSHLKNYVPRAKREKTFQCGYDGCSFSTATKNNLQRHCHTHLPASEKPFKCNYPNCNYGAIEKKHLKAHLGKRHGEMQYLLRCPHCSYTAARQTCLSNHMENHVPMYEETETFQCNHDGCSYSTDKIFDLKAHLETHVPPKKRIACSYEGCTYGAVERQELNAHLAAKHGELQYLLKCPQGCGFSTAWPSHLAIHIKTHDGPPVKLVQVAVGNLLQWRLVPADLP